MKQQCKRKIFWIWTLFISPSFTMEYEFSQSFRKRSVHTQDYSSQEEASDRFKAELSSSEEDDYSEEMRICIQEIEKNEEAAKKERIVNKEGLIEYLRKTGLKTEKIEINTETILEELDEKVTEMTKKFFRECQEAFGALGEDKFINKNCLPDVILRNKEDRVKDHVTPLISTFIRGLDKKWPRSPLRTKIITYYVNSYLSIFHNACIPYNSLDYFIKQFVKKLKDSEFSSHFPKEPRLYKCDDIYGVEYRFGSYKLSQPLIEELLGDLSLPQTIKVSLSLDKVIFEIQDSFKMDTIEKGVYKSQVFFAYVTALLTVPEINADTALLRSTREEILRALASFYHQFCKFIQDAYRHRSYFTKVIRYTSGGESKTRITFEAFNTTVDTLLNSQNFSKINPFLIKNIIKDRQDTIKELDEDDKLIKEKGPIGTGIELAGRTQTGENVLAAVNYAYNMGSALTTTLFSAWGSK